MHYSICRMTLLKVVSSRAATYAAEVLLGRGEGDDTNGFFFKKGLIADCQPKEQSLKKLVSFMAKGTKKLLWAAKMRVVWTVEQKVRSYNWLMSVKHLADSVLRGQSDTTDQMASFSQKSKKLTQVQLSQKISDST